MIIYQHRSNVQMKFYLSVGQIDSKLPVSLVMVAAVLRRCRRNRLRLARAQRIRSGQGGRRHGPSPCRSPSG